MLSVTVQCATFSLQRAWTLSHACLVSLHEAIAAMLAFIIYYHGPCSYCGAKWRLLAFWNILSFKIKRRQQPMASQQ